MKKLLLSLACYTISGLSIIAPAHAQESAEAYPSSEVTCIVIAAAGGGTDAMARAVTNPLEELMGKPFVVMNNGSAGGLIAMGDIASAKADGYTLGVFSNTDVANFAYTQDNLPISTDGFTYIAGLNTTGDVLVLKKGSSMKSVDDLIAHAKEHPGSVTVALPSSIQKMSLSLINENLGIVTTGVVYGGGNKVYADLLGGHVEAGILSAKFIQQSQDEDMTIVGLMLTERLSSFPDVPTFSEQGYEIDNPARRMLVGPKDIPQEIVAKIVENLKEGFEGSIRESITSIGEVPSLLIGDELATFLDNDFAMRKAFLEK